MVLKIRNICAVFILLIFNWSNFNKHLSSFKNLRKISHSYGRNFQILNSTKYFLKTIDKKRPRRSVVYKMVAMTGLEPVTPALWVRCSNQLSYIAKNCGRIILTFTTYVKRIFQKSWKWAYKPGSVEDDHSSRRTITHTLKRPTRIQYGPYLRIPIWSCFWWGLPCHELLPAMRCALTAPFHPYLTNEAVYSLLHLSSAHAA